jgi:hypothetical protein
MQIIEDAFNTISSIAIDENFDDICRIELIQELLNAISDQNINELKRLV